MSALKNNRTNYVIVGSFVIACCIGLIASVALLSGRTGATDAYFVTYNKVQGLKFGTQVVYEGYPVGQIEEITPVTQNGRVRFKVELSVTEGWAIPKDSVAAVSSAGLLSALTINIRAGQSTTPLTPGDSLKGIENADMFAAMSSLAEEISAIMETDVRPLLLSLNTAANGAAILMAEDGEEMAKKMKNILSRIEESTPLITANLSEFTTNLNNSGDRLEEILSEENSKQIAKTLKSFDNINTSLVQLNRMTANLDTLVAQSKPDVAKSAEDLRFVMETLSRHIDTISQNLEGTSRNMYEFSRHIRQNPGLLLGGTPPKDAAE